MRLNPSSPVFALIAESPSKTTVRCAQPARTLVAPKPEQNAMTVSNEANNKFSTCSYCGERYHVGPVKLIGGVKPEDALIYLPEAESKWLEHCTTPKHQQVMTLRAKDQKEMLDQVEKNWPAMQKASKLYHSEAYQQWLKILR